MTMPFHVAPQEDLSTLTPGTRVNFDLQVGKHASIAKSLKPQVVNLEADGKEIRIDPPPNKIALGALVPDFTLTDQSNRTVHLSDFHGRVIAIDFIYTRCPLPDVCPRLFGELRLRRPATDCARRRTRHPTAFHHHRSAVRHARRAHRLNMRIASRRGRPILSDSSPARSIRFATSRGFSAWCTGPTRVPSRTPSRQR